MPTVFWDDETRSTANLRDCGAHVYATSLDTAVLFFCFAVDDSDVQTWRPGDPVPEPFLTAAANPTEWKLVSDNWTFERCIYDQILVPRHGFPVLPLAVHDCAERLALANAYPAELGLRAIALGLPYRKDPKARRAMLAISRPKKARKGSKSQQPIWDEDPEKYALVLERCRTDVLATRACWQSLLLKPLSPTERRYLLLDAIINDRGVLADIPFLTAARDLAIRERNAINLKLAELTAGAITTVDQTARFLTAINARGHHMTTLNKRAVAQVLAGKPDGYVHSLLTLRRDGARASVRKFQRMLAFASADQRMRGTLRFHGSATGRWSGLGPQLQNLKKNEARLPLSVVDAVRNGDRDELARYGNPLALLGDISRAALCAATGHRLFCADFSNIESRVLAWFSGEIWKIEAFAKFDITQDKADDVYRIIAHRMLGKNTPVNETTDAERQIGKCAELASGFGGGVGAWRRIVGHDPRTDDEISANIRMWRDSHPATRQFWKDLARTLRLAIHTGKSIQVAPPPRPSIVALFANSNLYVTLPSGRTLTYPEARLVPGKFEEAPSDIEFKDNARGQWKAYRGWFGVFVENVVQAIARDLLAAAIERFETRGFPVVFHCHDEVVIEAPIGAITEEQVLKILLERPAWAEGLPLGGKLHSGEHYLEAPETPAEPLLAEIVETAIDVFLDEDRDQEITDQAELDREDENEFLNELGDRTAPLTDLCTLPMDASNHVCCPFHDDPEPSCTIYADHFHCYGCGVHGDRIDWLMQVEAMSRDEAIAAIADWSGPGVARQSIDRTDKIARALDLWNESQPLRGTPAETYLLRTRYIPRLPTAINHCLRFHPACLFGHERLPCLIALMRDPVTDEVTGIQRTALRVGNGRVEKIDRRMLGRAGIVKLWPLRFATQLTIGEGIETTLSGMILCATQGQDLRPAWAALSAGALGSFPVLPNVARLVLLTDHDPPGEQAAAACTNRWHCARRIVVELKPDEPGADFNDLLKGD
jgi:DNA polymerase